MSVPPVLNVHRHDADNRMVTLTGEIDLSSAPLTHVSPERCLHDGIRAIDVGVTAVAFCDRGGLNAFLHALPHTTAAGGSSLQLDHPSPAMERLVALTGSGSLFLALPDAFAGADRPRGPLRILVHPHARNRDVARRPQERLLAEHQAFLGITSADRADQPVPAALRSWGRKDAGDVRRAADGAVFLSLVLPWGVGTAARPEELDHHSWTGWSP
ncbi:STAS domain-containing protein [Streptomyces sp. NPDC058295]|uniref:STAS domain-containing protein n=1 Tax=Streptomyces sp. NPDC058295 TaxID=3346431 RepID=UPI0036E50848